MNNWYKDLTKFSTKSTPPNYSDIYIDPNTGDVYYYNDRNQISRLDGPAIEWSDGYKAWCIDGKLHRTDGPAIEYSNGSKFWFINGKLHRIDGPAIEYSDGSKVWYVDGKFIGNSTNGFTDKDFEEYKKRNNIISSLRFAEK